MRARGRPRRAAPSPCVPRSLAGPYGGPGRDPRRTTGRWSGPHHPPPTRRGALLRGAASYEAEGGDAGRGAAGLAVWGCRRAALLHES